MNYRNLLIFLFIFISTSLFSQNVDIDILKHLNVNRNTSLDGLFIFLSNSLAYIVYASLIGILVFSLIKKDKPLQHKAFVIILSFILAALISNILKYAIDAARPFETYPFIEKISVGGSPSFPSGHTNDAFAIATALSLAFRKWFILIPFFLWACLVGYSRMHLGVHYPSDVLAGAITGTGSALLCFYLNLKYFSKKKIRPQSSTYKIM